jgi:hypothetical protein
MEQNLKEKVIEATAERNLGSMMNDTKWKELQNAMENELPFEPPYDLKRVLNEDSCATDFDNDVWYLGDWSDEALLPFFSIEWVKIRPRYIKSRGRLVKGEMTDETEKFIAILNKYNLPYEIQGRTYVIYGYK